jgi:hypothetical protein
MLENGEGK